MGGKHNAASVLPLPSNAAEPGFYSYDVPSGITRGSARLAELFGVSTQECANGLPFGTLSATIHAEDRDRVMLSFGRAMQDGNLWLERYRLQPRHGEVMQVRAMGICFRDENAQPLACVGTIAPDEPIETVNVDRTFESALAAYRLAGYAGRPMAQFLIALALEDMGFVLPKPDDHD